jgi:hypothetical protein
MTRNNLGVIWPKMNPRLQGTPIFNLPNPYRHGCYSRRSLGGKAKHVRIEKNDLGKPAKW